MILSSLSPPPLAISFTSLTEPEFSPNPLNGTETDSEPALFPPSVGVPVGIETEPDLAERVS